MWHNYLRTSPDPQIRKAAQDLLAYKDLVKLGAICDVTLKTLNYPVTHKGSHAEKKKWRLRVLRHMKDSLSKFDILLQLDSEHAETTSTSPASNSLR